MAGREGMGPTLCNALQEVGCEVTLLNATVKPKANSLQDVDMEWLAQKNIQLRKGCSGRVIQGDYYASFRRECMPPFFLRAQLESQVLEILCHSGTHEFPTDDLRRAMHNSKDESAKEALDHHCRSILDAVACLWEVATGKM
jgi:hypothetical protein